MTKSIIFCLFIFATLFSTAQDITPLLKMDKAEAIAFANKVNSNIRTPWIQVELDEGNTSFLVYFVPATTSKEDIAKIKDTGIRLAGIEYYTVEFTHSIQGADEELEIEGTKVYQFDRLKLPFLDAFQVWEKLFFNGTTIKRVRADEDGIVKYENSSKKIKFSVDNKPYWTIVLMK